MFFILLYVSASHSLQIFFFDWETKKCYVLHSVKNLFFNCIEEERACGTRGIRRIPPTANSSAHSELTWEMQGLKSPSQWAIQLGCPLPFPRWLLSPPIPWLFCVDISWFPTTAFGINNYKFSRGHREKKMLTVLLVKTLKMGLGGPRLKALNQQIFNYFIYSGIMITKKYEKDQPPSSNAAWC